MAKKYFDELAEIVKSLKLEKKINSEIELKHFFTGAALYVNNHIFATLSHSGLALKFKREKVLLLLSKDFKELQYFPNGAIKKEYAVVPNRLINKRDELKVLFEESIAYVKTIK